MARVFKRIALVLVVLVIAGLGFVWWYDRTGQHPDLDFEPRVELPAYPSGPAAHGGRHPRVVIGAVGVDAIDAVHARATAGAAEFGLKKVFSATHQHGSYSFYLQDLDTNWWELEIWHDGISPVDRGLERTRSSG